MRVSENSLVRILFAAAAIALVPLGLFAETAPETLSVDQAVRAALANNLAVRSAAIESRIKKRSSDLSFNKFFPSVSVSGTAALSNVASPMLVGAPDTQMPSKSPTGLWPAYFTPSRTTLLLNLTVQEVFSATYFGLMDQCAIDYQRSLITKAQAEKSMTATVKKIFYQLLVQDEAIALTSARLDTANERLRQAEVSYQLGQTSELNYDYAKINVENLVPELRSLQSSRAAGLTQFQEILGFDSRPDMNLQGSLDDNAVPAGEPQARESERFDVRLARENERQLESALKLQRYALLPNLILQYTADPMLNGPETTSIWNTENWKQSQGALSLTLSWSLDSLLPASSLRVAKGEVEDRLALARENTVQTLRAARDDAVNQARSIKDSVDKIANLTNVADSSKRAYDLTNAAYQLGTGRFLDLQDAEVGWQGARMQLLSERLRLACMVYDFEAKFATAGR